MSQPPIPGQSLPPQPRRLPEEHKSNLLWWVLGLLATALVVLTLGGLLVVRYMARNIEVIQSGDRVEVRSPVGNMAVNKNAGDPTGLPEYPGARLHEPGASVELESATDERVTILAAKYRTPDAIDKVDEWYRQKLGREFEREGRGVTIRKKEIFGIEVHSDDIAYVAKKNDELRVVTLRQVGGHVEIAHVRIGEPSAN